MRREMIVRAARVAAIYAGLAAVWIVCSDRAAAWLFPDFQSHELAQTVKGIAFVMVTATLLFVLFRRELLSHRDAIEKEFLTQKWLKAMADHTTDIVFFKDAAGRYLFLNRAAEAITGKPVSEIVGKDDTAIFRSGEEAKMIEVDRDVLRTGQVITFEESLKDKQGRRRDLLTTKGPLHDTAGRIIGTFGVVRDITERRAAERVLQESEARLQKIFQDLPQVAIQGYGPDGTTQYWNKASEILYGYTAEEAVGRNLLDLIIPPEMRADVAQAIRRMAETGQPIPSTELSLMRKDGSRVAVFSSHAIIRSPDRPQELFCVDIDLSERKAAEEARRATESRLRVLGDNIPGGAIYELLSPPDGRNRFTYVSAGIERIFGVKAERILADPESFWALIVEDDLPRIMAAQEESARNLTVFDCEFRQRTVAGDVRWLQCRSTPRRLPDGSTIWDGVVTDVTHRRRVQAEMEEVSRQRQLALNSANMGWWHYDPVTKVATFDERYQQIFGVTGCECPNEEILKLLHPDDLPGVWAAVVAALDPADPKAYSSEYRVIRPDGTIRWVEAHGLATFEGAGDAKHAVSFVGTVLDVTERKLAEKTLAHSEARLRAFCSALPDVAFLLDEDGRYIEVLTASDNLLYRGAASLMGRTIAEVFPAAQTEIFMDIIRRTLESGEVQSVEYALQLDAGLTWFEGRTAPVKAFESGKRIVVFLARDITQRKRADEALRSGEALLRSITDCSDDMIFVKDREGHIIFMNPAGYRLSGLSPEQVIDRHTIESHGIETEAEQFAGSDRRVMETGCSETIEETCTTPDGQAHVLMTTKTPRLDSAGKIIGVVGVSRDITQRKRAVEALRSSEMLLRSITDCSDDMIFVKDREGRFVFMNPAGLRAVGMNLDQVLGRTAAEIHQDSAEAEKYVRDDELVMESRKPLTREETNTSLDGTRRLMLTTKSPRIDGDGNVTGVIGVAHDMTERRRAEEALKEKDELLRDVSEVAHIGGWTFDVTTGRGAWTDEVARIFGVDLCITPNVEFGLEFYAPESRKRIETAIKAIVDSAAPYDLELEIVTAPGKCKWVRTIGIPVLREGRVVRVRGALQDITLQKHQELELQRVNRLYMALSQINQSVVRAQSVGELFEIICHALVEYSGFKLAWVGSVDPQTQCITVVSCQGEARHYLDDLKFCVTAEVEDQCPVSIAVRQMNRVVVNEFTEETLANPWRERGLQVGFRSMAAFPLFFQNRVAGTLTVYAGEELFFQQREIELLEEAAADISFAWEKLHVAAEHARVVAQLHESEQRYRLLADNAEDFVTLSDTKGNRLYVSPSYYRVTGWSSDEDPAADWSDRVHPDDLPVIRRARAANLAGETTTIEHRVRCRDGSWIWVEAGCKPVRGRDGSIEHLLLWSHDITRRRQAEEESTRLATIVEQSAETIVITDVDGIIQYVNPAFERISGYTRAEAIGKNPRILNSGLQDPAFYKALWETLARGEVWSGHFTNRRKDGTLFEEEAIISPVRDSSGRVTGYAAMKRDVTAHIALRAEAERLQTQFLQAQKMETIGRLAGGVAHDFNNLLQAILGYADILLGQFPSGNPCHDDLLEIQKTGRRAAELTRHLLALGRKQNLDRRVADINALIEELSKMVRRVLGEDIQLEFQPGQNLERVLVDSGQIGQILLNLAVNARDAMPRGGRLVFATSSAQIGERQVAVHPGVAAGRFVCVAVTDTGTGMTPEILGKIFEPFFTTKEPGKGTGLGLATSYGIARQHGGWVEADSTPGQGSTFRLFLPAVEREAAGVEAGSSVPAVAKNSLHGAGERILLVEDEETIRAMLQRQLERSGYRVITASDAHDAHEQFERVNGEFDMILTDVVLPGQNGIELVEELLALKPDLRVLFSSGYTDNERRWPVILERKWPFIAKPYTTGELLAAMRKIFTAT